jgi:hypothetical protein
VAAPAVPLGANVPFQAQANVPDLEDYAGPGVASNEPYVHDLVSRYGNKWIPVGDEKISVYYIGEQLDTNHVTFNAVGQGLIARNGEMNLSFLRFKGISSPEGVKFVIVGPMGMSDARSMNGRVGAAAKQFFAEYLAPMSINLRVSSTEI